MTKTTKIIIAVSVALLATLLIVGVSAGLLWQHFWNNSISLDEAKEIVLQDAGLTETQVANLSTALENEDGEMVYSVEFRVGSTEYDYTVDAVKGVILQKETEQAAGAEPHTQVTENLTIQQVTDIVLRHAGLTEDQVDRMSISPDNEGGIPVFEVEFISDGTEYEYEVNAITGHILTHSAEEK